MLTLYFGLSSRALVVEKGYISIVHINFGFCFYQIYTPSF